ncbi:Swt1 family HEPN domain-containing protein [Candidatus Albibeggiatoa sp. nov. NOAA]|uniref:Swt1 family HEPN domain-containing protein n=1 Tax=Candidatus Albibeggiatoa sp. nov. NOAA TaxID=3162724 RepID=UPI0032FD152B|nr:Swt1 family HEPN domain-containing protein [Thiotrichaceae bacterium]
MELSIQYLCDAAAHALSQQSAYEDNKKKLNIKKIGLMNNTTISCEFYPHATESMDVKNEIAFIMGFLASFFKEEFRFDYIKNFAVKAFALREDERDIELMYVMSAPNVADFIAEGKAIQWITNSIFQENTPDFRMVMAKRQISRLENALRDVIDKVFLEVEGEFWWDKFISEEIRKRLPRDIRKNFEKSISSRSLLNKTYFHNLKSIIVQNWQYFSNIFHTEKDSFEKMLADFNDVRNDEAHNLEITSEKSEKLTNIYNNLMQAIGTQYPEFVPEYLVENWRIQIAKIVDGYVQNQIIIDKGESISNAIFKTQKMIEKLQEIEFKLESILIPPNKHNLHKELVSLFQTMCSSFQDMIVLVESNDQKKLQSALVQHEKNNEAIQKFTKKYLMSEV